MLQLVRAYLTSCVLTSLSQHACVSASSCARSSVCSRKIPLLLVHQYRNILPLLSKITRWASPSSCLVRSHDQPSLTVELSFLNGIDPWLKRPSWCRPSQECCHAYLENFPEHQRYIQYAFGFFSEHSAYLENFPKHQRYINMPLAFFLSTLSIKSAPLSSLSLSLIQYQTTTSQTTTTSEQFHHTNKTGMLTLLLLLLLHYTFTFLPASAKASYLGFRVLLEV
jgi:hypothetical protein